MTVHCRKQSKAIAALPLPDTSGPKPWILSPPIHFGHVWRIRVRCRPVGNVLITYGAAAAACLTTSNLSPAFWTPVVRHFQPRLKRTSCDGDFGSSEETNGLYVCSFEWLEREWMASGLFGCENSGAKRLVFSGLRRILNLWILPGFESFSGTTQIANQPSFLLEVPYSFTCPFHSRSLNLPAACTFFCVSEPALSMSCDLPRRWCYVSSEMDSLCPAMPLATHRWR